MHLIKTITEDIYEQDSVERVFENVQFTAPFFSFADALEQDGLTAEFVRHPTAEGIVWNDRVRAGGIKVVTEFHPSVNKGKAGTVKIRGSLTHVQQAASHLSRYASFKDKVSW